jgi:predicted Fe-S protein YdhL (DUF1289 family)
VVTPSPCIGTCRIDETSGFCIGCARTREEVAAWREASLAVREQIWAELPGRRAKLGVDLHRLGWTREDIRSFIAGTFRAGGGTWVHGVFGAIAEFCVGTDEAVGLDLGVTCLVATTPRGSIRFEISEDVRALTLATTVESIMTGVIVLVVPRARAALPSYTGLAALGPDRDAIREQDRDGQLYDFGLGMQAADFCIRTADRDLIEGLNAHRGQGWHDFLAGVGGRILQASPTRVTRSAIGRIEVFTRIPLPGGESPIGPHTHFLPAHLAGGRETPPGLDLPENLLPCAIFYPGPDVNAGTC